MVRVEEAAYAKPMGDIQDEEQSSDRRIFYAYALFRLRRRMQSEADSGRVSATDQLQSRISFLQAQLDEMAAPKTASAEAGGLVTDGSAIILDV